MGFDCCTYSYHGVFPAVRAKPFRKYAERLEMKHEIIITAAFWIFRVLAIAQVAIDVLGLLWFADYYFSLDHLWEAVVAVAPIVALLTGILSPNGFLKNSRGFSIALATLSAGCMFVVVQMYGDLTLINGPDYGAFKARWISLGLMVIFVLRVLHCKNKTQPARMP